MTTETAKAILESVSESVFFARTTTRKDSPFVPAFEQGKYYPVADLQAMAKFYLLRDEIRKVITDALRHSPLGSAEEAAARELLEKL